MSFTTVPFRPLQYKKTSRERCVVWYVWAWRYFEQEQCGEQGRPVAEKRTNWHGLGSNDMKDWGRWRVWNILLENMWGYGMGESERDLREYYWTCVAAQMGKIWRWWIGYGCISRAFSKQSGGAGCWKIPGVQCKKSPRCWRGVRLKFSNRSPWCMGSNYI